MQITSQLKYMNNRDFQFYESQFDTTWYKTGRTIGYLLKNEYHMNAAKTGIRRGDSGGPAIYNGNIIGVASYQRGNDLLNPISTGHVDITNKATIAWFDKRERDYKPHAGLATYHLSSFIVVDIVGGGGTARLRSSFLHSLLVDLCRNGVHVINFSVPLSSV